MREAGFRLREREWPDHWYYGHERRLLSSADQVAPVWRPPVLRSAAFFKANPVDPAFLFLFFPHFFVFCDGCKWHVRFWFPISHLVCAVKSSDVALTSCPALVDIPIAAWGCLSIWGGGSSVTRLFHCLVYKFPPLFESMPSHSNC